jgi:uncharacterized protein YndB with AHSA1/START domain
MFVLHAEAETEIMRPPDEVFEYLSNGENFPQWAHEFESMTKLSEGQVGKGTKFRFEMGAGRGRTVGGTVEWVEFVPPEKFAWHGEAVKRMRGTVTPRGTFNLEQRNGGTRVHVLFYPEIEGLSPRAKPFFAWFLKRSWGKDLKRLKAMLESRQDQSR